MTGIFAAEIETGRGPGSRRGQRRGFVGALYPHAPGACAGFAVSAEASTFSLSASQGEQRRYCAEPTTLRLLGYLENQAGRGGVSEEAALGVGDARFGGGGAAADIQRTAFAAHHA